MIKSLSTTTFKKTYEELENYIFGHDDEIVVEVEQGSLEVVKDVEMMNGVTAGTTSNTSAEENPSIAE